MMISHTSVPIDLDRAEARELARRELAEPGYERGTSWPAQALEWILDRIEELINSAGDAIPSGLGSALLLAAAAIAVIVILVRTRPMARRKAGRDDAIFAGHRRSAAEHRTAADASAQRGEWSTAVIERFRGVVAAMEERDIIEARSGRTADEVARDAGALLADTAGNLVRGARLFDEVRYGGWPATSDDDASMRELDRAVQVARPRAARANGATPAVPR